MSDKSVLNELIQLNTEAIKRYCHDVKIHGEIAQVIELDLKPNQHAWASRGSLISYDDKIQWQLKIPGGAGKSIGRALSGEGLSLTYVTAPQGGKIRVTANETGKLATWDLRNGPITCTSGAFVAAVGDVDISVTAARSAGAAFFGGAGLFLQHLSGTGVVVIHGAGDFIEHQLKQGEKLLVSTGNLSVFSAETQYDIRSVGGCLKMLFGGEGLFMTEMTGPGWVMLQSLKRQPKYKSKQ